jgi:hypothetical protein
MVGTRLNASLPLPTLFCIIGIQFFKIRLPKGSGGGQ